MTREPENVVWDPDTGGIYRGIPLDDPPLSEYEDDAPEVGKLPWEREPEVVSPLSPARVLDMPDETTARFRVGDRVRVSNVTRYDDGVAGQVFETKPGEQWIRVWTDQGLGVWYNASDLAPERS